MDDFLKGDRVCTWRLSSELDDLMRIVARYEDRSKSALVRRAVLAYLHSGGYLEPGAVPEIVPSPRHEDV